MFKSLICTLSGHKINRRRVRHDGVEFRTRCQRCDAPMLRSLEGWEVDDSGKNDRSSPRVRHDGVIFRSRCQRCDAPLLRAVSSWDGDDSGQGNKLDRAAPV